MNLNEFFEKLDKELEEIETLIAAEVLGFLEEKTAQIFRNGGALETLSANNREKLLTAVRVGKFNQIQSTLSNEQFKGFLSTKLDYSNKIFKLVTEEIKIHKIPNKLTPLKVSEVLKDQGEVFASKLSSYVGDIKRILVEQSITGIQTTERTLLEQGLTPTKRSQIKAEVSTQIRVTYRQASLKNYREAGIEKLEYFGTLIKESRPFCVANLGKVRTLEEWATMNNGQGTPVLTHCGGHRCRHHLIPFDEDE